MTDRQRIRIMLVDDHKLVRRGIAALLSLYDDLVVVGEAAHADAALEQHRALRPDVTLMDLRMPRVGRLAGGVEAIGAIRRESPRARFIVLTTYDGDEDVYRALEAGAQGYLLKDVGPEALLAAIRTVHGGGRHVPPALADRALARATGSTLTAREVDVLRLLVAGRSNKEMADDLAITENTVKGHIKSLFEKLGVGTRTQAAMAAVERGLIKAG